MLFLLAVKNASEYAFYVSRDEIVTITMATLLSTKHKLIFTAVHRTNMLTLHCTSVLQERLKQRIVVWFNSDYCNALFRIQHHQPYSKEREWSIGLEG